MTEQDWRVLIESRMKQRRPAVKALQYQGKKWRSISNPALMLCDDGLEYVVKYFKPARMLVNDQVVGILGRAMGAPVPAVGLVEMPGELVAAEPELAHIPAGVWHGSQLLPGVSEDREAFAHQNLPENRERFALLAVLYGNAMAAGDHQFLYRKQPPQLVFSHDHGHFFPGGPNWTLPGLIAAPGAVPDPIIVANCVLTRAELATALNALTGITDDVIATAVAMPLDDWGILINDRVALALYLHRRRTELSGQLQSVPNS